MNTKHLPFCLALLAATGTVGVAVAGPDEQSSVSGESDRFVINSGTLAISRPDGSWEFQVDASNPPVVARMRSSDAVANADVQVQEVPGIPLDRVTGMIEQALASQYQDFTKLSGRDVNLNGLEAHELECTLKQDGMPHRARILICKPGDTLYVVKCAAPVDQWNRFEKAFDQVIASFEVLAAAANDAKATTRPQAPVQLRRFDQDPKLNNLVHREGYATSALGELGRVTKVGNGSQEMILIAGAGFGGDIYDNFMDSHKDEFTMYVVTLPGFGGTAAPPMPPAGTSYGEQTWTRAAQEGVERLIADKKMKRPIVVGHWLNATQVALRLALDNPDKIRAVIIISGVPKNATLDAQRGTYVSPEQRAEYMDTTMAPRWFKTVTRDTWDDNNYYPHDYAIHPVRALQLWREAARPPLPVMIRYLCEYWAQDVTVELDRLTVPTLVLKPGFDKDFYFVPGQDYMQATCHDSWQGVEDRSTVIRMRTIEDSRVFIMDDQPEKLDAAIEEFLAEI